MSNIRWARGFFRVWLVVALLWVFPVGVIYVNGVSPLFFSEKLVENREGSDSRGERANREGAPLDERDDLTEEIFERIKRQEIADLRANLGSYVLRGLGVAFFPPLILLGIGWVIAWVSRGFGRNPK